MPATGWTAPNVGVLRVPKCANLTFDLVSASASTP